MRHALSWQVEAEEVAQPGPGAGLVQLRDHYEEHAPAIRGALARLAGPDLDPDDLLQEVFLVALRREKALALHPEPRAWLHRVAINVASAARRKARFRRFLGLDQAAEVANDDSPHRTFEQVEASRRVYRALDNLSEKKRTVFILFELEELTGEEIARIVDCPLKTVWTRLHHARKEFAMHLQQDRGEA